MIKFGKDEDRKIRDADKGELKGWIRRIEQNVNSIDKRLDAVERRLSGEEFIPPKIVSEGRKYQDELENKIQEIYKKLNGELKDIKSELDKFDELIRKNSKNKNKKAPIVISSVYASEKQKSTDKHAFIKDMADIERRLERLEKRKATVKLGKVEIPIEITGVVGGSLSLVISILLLSGYKNIVISPAFSALAGIILIIAVAVKTYFMNKK